MGHTAKRWMAKEVVLNPILGGIYHYLADSRKFKVKEIRKFTVIFECGHWCTDNVFRDLILINGPQITLL